MQLRRSLSSVGLFVLTVLATTLCYGTDGPLKPIREWRGSVADEALMNEFQKPITSSAELRKLWTDWKIKSKRPKIDFSKQLVVVVTSRGSGLGLQARLDESGDLKANGLGTMDVRPGFRYVIATINRKGIKSINGTPLESSGQSTAMVTGTVTYRQRIAMPPGVIVEVTLSDVSLADAPAVVLAREEIKPTTQVPIPFTLKYDASQIDQTHSYAVSARILVEGKLWFTSTARYLVITHGNPSKVEIWVDMVKGD